MLPGDGEGQYGRHFPPPRPLHHCRRPHHRCIITTPSAWAAVEPPASTYHTPHSTVSACPVMRRRKSPSSVAGLGGRIGDADSSHRPVQSPLLDWQRPRPWQLRRHPRFRTLPYHSSVLCLVVVLIPFWVFRTLMRIRGSSKRPTNSGSPSSFGHLRHLHSPCEYRKRRQPGANSTDLLGTPLHTTLLGRSSTTLFLFLGGKLFGRERTGLRKIPIIFFI